MHSRILKFLPTVLLGVTLIFWGYTRQQAWVPVLASAPNPSKFISPDVGRKPALPSITEQIYQQSEKDFPFPELSEVPFLSVRLSNYLARHNGKIRICGGETQQPFYKSYFPKLYQLNSREYLVEQICQRGAYNIRFSYLIYRLGSPLDESQMRARPRNDYSRDDYGYYYLKKNKVDQSELTIPVGMLTPLAFDTYSINKSGRRVKFVSDVTGGKRLFDAKRRTLWVLSKGRGIGDCGVFARYQLETDEFKLLEYRSQKCCDTEEKCNVLGYRRPPHEYPKIYP